MLHRLLAFVMPPSAASLVRPAPRPVARDDEGRFVSAHRLKVLAKAREMRAAAGLPPHPVLDPEGTVSCSK